MIDANAELGPEVFPLLEARMLLRKLSLEIFCTVSVRGFCWLCLPLIMSRLLVRMEVAPHGGTPIVTGEELILFALPLYWLSACSNAHTWQHGELAHKDREDHRAASVDVSLQLPCIGQRVNRNFASRRALKLPDVEDLWRSVPSWPQHWHIDRMEASLTKLARIIFATVAPPEKRCPKADWITPDIWAVIELHRDCRHHFFAMIRQRKSLLLRLAFWAWSPFTVGQARKARADLAGNRLESALQARFLQLVAKQASKATQADRRSWLRRQADSIQADLDNGVSTSLWPFVRYLSKKKARKGLKPVVVLRTPQGSIASTSEDLAKVWQDTFFNEIDRR